MYSKLTLADKPDSGKTAVLRYLTYLLLRHNTANICGIVYNNKFYPNYASFPWKHMFNNHVDFRIMLYFNQAQMSQGNTDSKKEYSICICTVGDKPLLINKNWDFAKSHLYTYFNSKETKIAKEADIFISPCHHTGVTFQQEQDEQKSNFSSKNNSLNLIYWFNVNGNNNFCKIINAVQIDKDLYDIAEKNNVFYSPKYPRTLSPAQELHDAQLATLIEDKIYKLSKLL